LSTSWPGFVPAIHVFLQLNQRNKAWMPATSAGMTSGKSCAFVSRVPREVSRDRLHNARRDRQRRIAVGGEIGGALRRRKLEHMVDAIERHHGDATARPRKPSV